MDNLDVKKPEFMTAAFKKFGEMDVDDNPLSPLSFADLFMLKSYIYECRPSPFDSQKNEILESHASAMNAIHNELKARTKAITGLDL